MPILHFAFITELIIFILALSQLFLVHVHVRLRFRWIIEVNNIITI